jgi:hypothetical protein
MRKWIAVLSGVLAICLVATLLCVVHAAPDHSIKVPGTYELKDGANNGYNFYHIEGVGSDGLAFYQPTFCTHKNFSSAPGSYIYYYNDLPGEDALSNPEYYGEILNNGTTTFRNGLEMTPEQYRKLRYCMLYTNFNKDPKGQKIYWSWLGHFIPHRYSEIGGLGFQWTDDYLTYFGANESANFMGLGAIADGDTLGIGDSCSTVFYYEGSNVTNTVTSDSPPTYPAYVADDELILGPFKIDWDPSSDPVLAQLNCGADKQTPPKFKLKTQDAADASYIRFYKSGDMNTPVTTISIGDEFYVAYHGTKAHLALAAGGITIPVCAVASRDIFTMVKADMFFIHPNAENQINVDVEKSKPQYNFSVSYRSTYVAPPTPDPYTEYARPTVEKQVTEDNHLNANGAYVDVLEVPEYTDVLHKMTVHADDPKGTILTFQNVDYDLHLGRDDTAYVSNTAEFLAAVNADRNIKLMADIQIPSNWTPSNTQFSKILDGNGYKFIGPGMGTGDAAMTQPLFRVTNDAVFYRVQFVDFKMNRTITSANVTDGGENRYYGGGLVDWFKNSGGARMINCFVQGSITFSNQGLSSYKATGGIAGKSEANEIYAVRGLISINVTGNSTSDLDNFDEGGLFGIAVTPSFENNILLEGSVIIANAKTIGGIAGRLYMENGSIRNCEVEYTLSNATGISASGSIGGFAGYIENCAVIYRSFAYITSTYSPNPSPGYLDSFAGFALLDVTTDLSMTNCEVIVSGSAIKSQYASGLVIFNSYTGSQRNIGISICQISANLRAKRMGAGIWLNRDDKDGSNNNTSFRYVISADNCKTSGSITTATTAANGAVHNYNGANHDNAYLGGIAVTGEENVKITAVINQCISTCIITGSQLTSNAARSAGIFAHDWNNTSGNSVTITHNLFAGEISENDTLAYEIYSITTSATSVISAMYNYNTCGNHHGKLHTEPTGALIGEPDAFFGSAPNNSWYMGLDISTSDDRVWLKPSTKGIPSLAPNQMRRKPVQRVYVNDYYHQETGQLDISNFLVYEDGAFKPIWQSSLAASGSNSASTDITLAGEGDFVFYYKRPDIPVGSWQNTVKIIPKEDLLNVGDSNYGLKDDFLREEDDDWVLAKEGEFFLNIVKMTSAHNYPIPLEGSTFRLYRSEVVYSDLSGVSFNTWQYEDITPSGYDGATFVAHITSGSYVLKEIVAPAYYDTAENLDRTWYIIFTNGEISVYLNDPTMSNEQTRVTLGEMSTQNPQDVVYNATIQNGPDPGMPYARVRVTKWNEDGTQQINGQLSTTDNNLPYFTGAVYGLLKFSGNDFTGEAHEYGNMLRAGNVSDNFCDIEYGYYWLIERQAPVGYATDPTPIYIKYTATDGLQMYKDGHEAGVDQVGYMDGVQDLTVTYSTSNEDGTAVLNINTRDKKPEYRLVLEKYALPSNRKISGITFELKRISDGSSVGSFVTDSNGRLTIDLPQINCKYILSEVLTQDQELKYASASDYTIETRDGAIIIGGGPHNYQDIKIIHGVSDFKSYVILDADGFAKPVLPGDPDYPKDIEPLEDDQIAVISTKVRVPNETLNSTTQTIQIIKEDWNQSDPKTGLLDAVFTIYDASDTQEQYPLYVISANSAPTEIETGEYIMAETTVPDGYTLPSQRWRLQVTSSEVIVTGGMQYMAPGYSTLTRVEKTSGVYKITVPNYKPITGLQPFKLVKEDEDDSSINELTARFELYNSGGSLLFTLDTPSDEVFFLSPGAYDLYETVFPNGYAETQYSYILLVSDGMNMIYGGDGVHNPYITAENSINAVHIPNKFEGFANTDFSFIKTDKDGTPLASAQFSLYECSQANVDGHTHSELAGADTDCWELAQTAESDADGLVEFTELSFGDYMLVETATPSGYSLPMGQWLIHIDAADETITITAKGSEMPPAFKVETDENGATSYYLPNYPNIILPKAGKTSALLFSAMGGLLTLLALVLALLPKKNKASANN